MSTAFLLLAAGSQGEWPFPTIDMHLHAFSFDEYGHPVPANEVTGEVPTFHSNDEYFAAVVTQLAQHRIVRAVASGPLPKVREWQAALPGHIHGGAYMRPRQPLPPLEELRRLVEDREVEVFGEWGLQYRGLNPSDPDLAGYWELAEELDVPVGVHTGLGDSGTPYGCCPKFRARLGQPLLLEEILVKHPALRLYLMHGVSRFLSKRRRFSPSIRRCIWTSP